MQSCFDPSLYNNSLGNKTPLEIWRHAPGWINGIAVRRLGYSPFLALNEISCNAGVSGTSIYQTPFQQQELPTGWSMKQLLCRPRMFPISKFELRYDKLRLFAWDSIMFMSLNIWKSAIRLLIYAEGKLCNLGFTGTVNDRSHLYISFSTCHSGDTK